MLIEFYLDYNAFASMNYYLLLDDIDEWARKHKVKYQVKRKKQILRLCFNDERYYQWFALTWDNLAGSNYRIVDSRTN